MADGEGGGGGAGVELELGQQVGDVEVDGARADEECLADLADDPRWQLDMSLPVDSGVREILATSSTGQESRAAN